jgi:uncharacterized protein YndB with AHSA1/START domain
MRRTLSFDMHLDAPASQVWHLITDTRRWPQWGPSVRAVDCAERFIRAGARGRVRTPLGVWVPFVIEAFEPERYWDWRVAGLPATGHRVEPRGPSRCTLCFTVPIWAAAYGPVCWIALGRIKQLLAS